MKNLIVYIYFAFSLVAGFGLIYYSHRAAYYENAATLLLEIAENQDKQLKDMALELEMRKELCDAN